LEELNADASGQEYNQKKGKRKTQGVFYTPAFITQYIVEVSLGGYLNRREAELRSRFQLSVSEKTGFLEETRFLDTQGDSETGFFYDNTSSQPTDSVKTRFLRSECVTLVLLSFGKLIEMRCYKNAGYRSGLRFGSFFDCGF
jgi:hypothetical protein